MQAVYVLEGHEEPHSSSSFGLEPPVKPCMCVLERAKRQFTSVSMHAEVAESSRCFRFCCVDLAQDSIDFPR